MRTIYAPFMCAVFFTSGYANASDPIGANRAEASIAASCRAWDGYAWKAAHPDAETIARHDAMLQKANALLQSNGDPGEIAQIQIEAADLYDYRRKQSVADECWANLGVVREDNARRMEELDEAAASIASRSSQQTYSPNPEASQLPPPPKQLPPMETPDVTNFYTKSPPNPPRCIGELPAPGIGLNQCPSN